MTGEGHTAGRRQVRAFWAALLVWLCVGLTVIGFWYTAAEGQAPLGDPTLRRGERRPFEGLEPRPPPPPVQILPPLPSPSEREVVPLPGERVFVREIRVTGSTVFSADELAKVTAPYVNREVTTEELEALRIALTLLYVNNGYVNSGAILPDQTVTDGVITFHIIEGELTSIEVAGNRWFRAGYLQKRLSLGAGPPLNINTLQEQIQLLLEDQRIQRLNAGLKPGLKPGESLLSVQVEERIPLKLWFDFNNHQSPSVGAEHGIITLEHQNLTGNGDILTARYGRSKGLNPLLDFKYAFPLTALDTTLSFQYRRNTSVVIEQPFNELEIKSKSEIYGIGLRQPIYRTLTTEFAIELTGERLSSKTLLLGEPFPLSPGANEKGVSVVTALRPALEWVSRTENQVISVRSRFSVGLDALGATINRDGEPDGRFFAWLAQFQWVRRLGILDTQLIFRSDIQLTDRPLLSLEQIPVGGRFSVRGYRENTLVRDNAFLTSLEARVPLIRNTLWADYVELAPFFDYGRPWNTKFSSLDPKDIFSVGVGLRWAISTSWPISIRPQFELYWGYPLRKIKTSGNDLQDNGIHLQFIIAAF